MILDLASHYTEGVVARVVVNVDSAEACRATGWDPLLIGIVIHHDSSSRLADALFTAGTRDIEKDWISKMVELTFLSSFLLWSKLCEVTKCLGLQIQRWRHRYKSKKLRAEHQKQTVKWVNVSLAPQLTNKLHNFKPSCNLSRSAVAQPVHFHTTSHIVNVISVLVCAQLILPLQAAWQPAPTSALTFIQWWT